MEFNEFKNKTYKEIIEEYVCFEEDKKEEKRRNKRIKESKQKRQKPRH
jgi:hypothetical protein